MNAEDESDLEKLFEEYRASCPDVEPSPGFMPGMWRRIDNRQNFWFAFQRFAGASTATASAVLCVLLLVLNFVFSPQAHPVALTYTDALMADHTAEKTYYAEAIRAVSSDDDLGGVSPQPAPK